MLYLKNNSVKAITRILRNKGKKYSRAKSFCGKKVSSQNIQQKNIPLHFKTEAKTLVRILSKKMNMFLLDRTKTNSSSLNNDSKRGTCWTTNYLDKEKEKKSPAISEIRTYDPLIKRRSLCRCATLADLLSVCSQENVWGWTEQSGDDVTDFSRGWRQRQILAIGQKTPGLKKADLAEPTGSKLEVMLLSIVL